jgi:hypothetical protein
VEELQTQLTHLGVALEPSVDIAAFSQHMAELAQVVTQWTSMLEQVFPNLARIIHRCDAMATLRGN